MFHGIDLDPRWVKKLAARGAAAEVSMYVDHVLDQAEFILRTQTRREPAHHASAVRGDRT